MPFPEWVLGKSPMTPEKRLGGNFSVGNEYIVYAIIVKSDTFWCYIIDDNEFNYPQWYPIQLFEIVDPTPSSYWVVGYQANPYYPHRVGASVLSFPEWAQNFFYYDQLYHEDPEAQRVFSIMRSLIDQEDKQRQEQQRHL